MSIIDVDERLRCRVEFEDWTWSRVMSMFFVGVIVRTVNVRLRCSDMEAIKTEFETESGLSLWTETTARKGN